MSKKKFLFSILIVVVAIVAVTIGAMWAVVQLYKYRVQERIARHVTIAKLSFVSTLPHKVRAATWARVIETQDKKDGIARTALQMGPISLQTFLAMIEPSDLSLRTTPQQSQGAFGSPSPDETFRLLQQSSNEEFDRQVKEFETRLPTIRASQSEAAVVAAADLIQEFKIGLKERGSERDLAEQRKIGSGAR